MDIVSALVVIALLLVGATALGVVVRARSARVASGCGGDEHDLSVDGAEVTLVQLLEPRVLGVRGDAARARRARGRRRNGRAP
ncbi:MAG: hypothetical protein ACJLS2_10535 [Microcella pacifica]